MKQYLKESLRYILRSEFLIKREIKVVESLYKLDAEQLTSYKEDRFLTLFRHAITSSKFYRKFYSEAGVCINDVQSLDDIRHLPILTKDILRKNLGDILTAPVWKVFKAKTSGTTGTPLTIFQSYGTIKIEQAYIWVRRKRYGFSFGEPLVSLRGSLGHDKFKLFIHSSNTLFLSSYNISKQNSQAYYREIKEFSPKAIEGYPSSLYNLCVFLREQNLSLHIPLVFTSSETLHDFQRILIEEVLNTRIYDRYGCTERTISLAQNIDEGSYYEEPGYSINEFKEDSIYTTSLINDTFPLIRYVVNDRINFESTGLEKKINSIEGRVEDSIVCKDGTLLSRNLLKNATNIKMVQIIQTIRGAITINIVPDEGFGQDDKQIIAQSIYEKAGFHNLDIHFQIINEDDIIYSRGNKYSLIISRIKR